MIRSDVVFSCRSHRCGRVGGKLLAAVAVLAFAASRSVVGAPPPGLSAGQQQEGLRVVQELFTTPANPAHVGKCFVWGDRSVLVDVNTTEDALWQIVMAMPDPTEGPRYQLGNRWMSTATDPVVTFREPFTLTYSFVPDGTLAPDRNNILGPSTLFASFNSAFGSEEAWRSRFSQYMAEWGAITGIMYVEVEDDGVPFGSPGSNVPGTIRGDCRIACRFLDGPSNVLAFNYFPGGPNAGEMVFDSGDASFFGTPSGDFRRFRNTTMHEHGHGIGMFHVDPINNSKLMEAFLATNFSGPQQDDYRGSQRNYGDDLEANNSVGAAFPLGLLPVDAAGPYDPVVLTNIAIEDDGLEDFYSFEARMRFAASIVLTPVGTLYSQGPQNGSVSIVDALRIHNLAFDLIDVDGSTVLQSVNATGLGAAESLLNFDLTSGAGTYFLRVYSTSTTNDIQRYTLSVNIVPDSTTPILVYENMFVVDDTITNSNGAIEPGELNVELDLSILNVGLGTATNPTATLTSAFPTAFVVSGNSTYPTIASMGQQTNLTPFVIGAASAHPCGQPLLFTLTLVAPEGMAVIPVQIVSGVETVLNLNPPAADVPLPVPDNTNASSFIQVTQFGTVASVVVQNVNLTHSAIGDLVLTLVSPSGQEVTLMSGDGGSGNNLVNTTFDSTAALIITGAAAPFTGTFRPRGDLGSLVGEPINGTWTLSIDDSDLDDSGTLTGWSLLLVADSHVCPLVPAAAGDWQLFE